MDAEESAQPFLLSDVWEQFTRKKDAARCNLCAKEYNCASSTSILQKHLRTSHSNVWKKMDHQSAEKTNPITSWVVSKGNTQGCSRTKAKSIIDLIRGLADH